MFVPLPISKALLSSTVYCFIRSHPVVSLLITSLNLLLHCTLSSVYSALYRSDSVLLVSPQTVKLAPQRLDSLSLSSPSCRLYI